MQPDHETDELQALLHESYGAPRLDDQFSADLIARLKTEAAPSSTPRRTHRSPLAICLGAAAVAASVTAVIWIANPGPPGTDHEMAHRARTDSDQHQFLVRTPRTLSRDLEVKDDVKNDNIENLARSRPASASAIPLTQSVSPIPLAAETRVTESDHATVLLPEPAARRPLSPAAVLPPSHASTSPDPDAGKKPREAIAIKAAIKASEVLENLKKHDAIYESGFSASGSEEGKDRMELRFGSFLGVKRRWMFTCGDDRFGYTAEVIEYEKLKYQQLMERQRTRGRRGLQMMDQDEDSVEPLLTTIRTRRWGYWGQDLSGHYYEDTGFEVTPEDKAMERGKRLHTAVHGPADTSITASKYVFLYALGRFFSKDLDKVTRVEKSKDGLLVVSALGTSHRCTMAPYSSGRWELEIDPAADWMVRKARFYSTAEPQSNWAGIWTEMTNSGTVWSGPYCIPKEAIINCFGSINAEGTHRLTFDPVVGKFDEKLYSTVRQAVGYNKDPGVEVHDDRVSPPKVTQPNRPKP